MDMPECTKQTKDKPFYLYLEALRIFAIFWVIFIHTGDSGFSLFKAYDPKSLPFWACMFVTGFCMAAVPAFLAISGAVMLGRENEPLRELWKKRILKMVLLLCAYSFAYFIWQNRKDFRGWETLRAFPMALYSKLPSVHLWFLYLYIAFLISLPFLRAIAQKLDKKYYWYLFALVFILGDLRPIWEFFIWKGSVSVEETIIPSWLFGRIPLFVLAGYFFHTKIESQQITARHLIALWICNIMLLLFVSCARYYRDFVVYGIEDLSGAFFDSFALVNCAAWFLTFKYAFAHIKIRGGAGKAVGIPREKCFHCLFGPCILHEHFVLLQNT